MASETHADLDDKITTYRWFVTGVQYAVLVHIAALIFGAIWFFSGAGFIVAALAAVAVLIVGALILRRPKEEDFHHHPGEPPLSH